MNDVWYNKVRGTARDYFVLFYLLLVLLVTIGQRPSKDYFISLLPALYMVEKEIKFGRYLSVSIFIIFTWS